MKNLTYDELINIAPKDRPFQIEVESNPYGKGGKQVLWARFDDDGDLYTYWYGQGNIDGVDYAWTRDWQDYKGKFTLIDPRYQKPEVLKVGQKVRIMESFKELGTYDNWDEEETDIIGQIFSIEEVEDDNSGVYYTINRNMFPHYCVQPVEEEEEIQEIPELEGTLDQLSTLIEKAQEIVDKYKK
jgi:hypothetical protein